MLYMNQGLESPTHAWFCLLLSFYLFLIFLPFLDQFSHLLLPLVCDHCPSLAGAAQLYGQVEACALSSPPDPPGEQDQKRLGSGQSGGCPRPRLSVSRYIQWVTQRGPRVYHGSKCRVFPSTETEFLAACQSGAVGSDRPLGRGDWYLCPGWGPSFSFCCGPCLLFFWALALDMSYGWFHLLSRLISMVLGEIQLSFSQLSLSHGKPEVHDFF